MWVADALTNLETLDRGDVEKLMHILINEVQPQ